jgi:coiled-coil domain-containing protein 77
LQVLRLQAENDALKTQEIEDRRRIQHLLALTEPVTHEV